MLHTSLANGWNWTTVIRSVLPPTWNILRGSFDDSMATQPAINESDLTSHRRIRPSSQATANRRLSNGSQVKSSTLQVLKNAGSGVSGKRPPFFNSKMAIRPPGPFRGTAARSGLAWKPLHSVGRALSNPLKFSRKVLRGISVPCKWRNLETRPKTRADRLGIGEAFTIKDQQIKLINHFKII